MGILYIASYLEKFGHSVKIIDVRAKDKTLIDIIQIIDDEKPKIVGISFMTTNISNRGIGRGIRK